MEHIQPSLSDWLRQWELEQTRLELIRQQEEAARIEATRVSSGLLNQEPTVDDTNFILPGSLKGADINFLNFFVNLFWPFELYFLTCYRDSFLRKRYFAFPFSKSCFLSKPFKCFVKSREIGSNFEFKTNIKKINTGPVVYNGNIYE